jgi:hypothetical protein
MFNSGIELSQIARNVLLFFQFNRFFVRRIRIEHGAQVRGLATVTVENAPADDAELSELPVSRASCRSIANRLGGIW